MRSSLVQFLEIRREEEAVPMVEALLVEDSEAADSADLAADRLVVEVQAAPGRRNRTLLCSTVF